MKKFLVYVLIGSMVLSGCGTGKKAPAAAPAQQPSSAAEASAAPSEAETPEPSKESSEESAPESSEESQAESSEEPSAEASVETPSETTADPQEVDFAEHFTNVIPEDNYAIDMVMQMGGLNTFMIKVAKAGDNAFMGMEIQSTLTNGTFHFYCVDGTNYMIAQYSASEDGEVKTEATRAKIVGEDFSVKDQGEDADAMSALDSSNVKKCVFLGIEGNCKKYEITTNEDAVLIAYIDTASNTLTKMEGMDDSTGLAYTATITKQDTISLPDAGDGEWETIAAEDAAWMMLMPFLLLMNTSLGGEDTSSDTFTFDLVPDGAQLDAQTGLYFRPDEDGGYIVRGIDEAQSCYYEVFLDGSGNKVGSASFGECPDSLKEFVDDNALDVCKRFTEL